VNTDIRVLLVDDEKRFVSNLAKLLGTRGFDTAVAFDGRTAVNLIKEKGGFDVVVLDVKMPGMDGIEALHQIKEIAPDMEVIMLTGHASVESGVRAIRQGAYDYLMKPCDIEDLAEKIRKAHETVDIRRHPVLWPRNFVKEIAWHDFPRITPEAGLVQALEIFCRDTDDQMVEKLYLIDAGDQLSGVITKRDLLNAVNTNPAVRQVDWTGLVACPGLLPGRAASEIMRPATVTAPADMPLAEVAGLMIAHSLRSIPVLADGRMIGIARLQDIFLHVAHEIK
jgi:CheY-like chemotaxis protein